MISTFKKSRLEKYIQIWKKVRNLLNIKFGSEPVYGDNNDKKIKLYDDNVNTSFHGKTIPKLNIPCKCLSLIKLDSVIKVNKKYSLQILLEECKYEIKKDEMERFIKWRIRNKFI